MGQCCSPFCGWEISVQTNDAFSVRSIGTVALLVMAFSSGSPDTVRGQEMIGSKYIPVDGMVTAVASPARIMKSETLAMYPTEIVDGWCIENIGVPLSKVSSAQMIVATPGLSDAMFAAVFKFTEPVGLDSLSGEFVGDAIKVDGHDGFEFNGPPGVVLHQLAADTIVVSSTNYLDSVLRSKGDQAIGPLAKLASATPRQGNLTILFAVEPIRPLLSGLLQSMVDKVPPPLAELVELPQLLQSITLRIDVDDRDRAVELLLTAGDADSAASLEKSINDAIAFGRQIAMAETLREIDGEGAVPDAMREYTNRMADRFVAAITPKREGKTLSITAPLNYGLASQAVMASMLLPAVRTARFQTTTVRTRNNLKQIGLAMHNHHSAYRELPGNAIRDDQGRPLLSWRVKILPFVEQQALYHRFRLDEPWDSEHNLKLLDEMPDVYRHPRAKTKDGFTVYQVPLNDGCLFKSDEPRKFRDVGDGLSNTVMILERDPDEAVPWTKPDDWEIDMDRPFGELRFNNDGSFNVLLSDGAALTLRPSTVGSKTMKALLTIDGRERVPELTSE
jgi:hypothetical protein